MQILVLGLCLAAAFVHGASSQLVPESVVTTLIEQDNSTQKYKRQTTTQLQCVSNRLEPLCPNASQLQLHKYRLMPQTHPGLRHKYLHFTVPTVIVNAAMLLTMHTMNVVPTAVLQLVLKHSILVCVEQTRMETYATNSMAMV